MTSRTFQFIRGFIKQIFSWKKNRRAPKPLFQNTWLFVEPLEVRDLLSLNAWMPQRIDPLNGINQPNQTLQIFQPASDSIEAQLGLRSGSIAIAGDIALVDDGTYNLDLQESGPLGSGTFSFSETGTLSFSLTEMGTMAGAGYSVNSLVLTQAGALAWSFQQTDQNGNTLTNQGGTDNVNVTSLGTAVLDAFFWDGLNWYDPTQQVIQDESLNLGFASASSFSVNETAGYETYSFQVTDGTETMTGSGNQLLPDMLQSGTQGFTYTLGSTFSYTNIGADTFTLGEQGSSAAGVYSLNCVNYSEIGDSALSCLVPGQFLGYDFQFTQAGTVAENGPGNLTSNQSSGGGSGALNQTLNQSYEFNNNLTYTYAESGNFAGFTFTEAGSYSNGSFNLNSVAYNAQGNGTYALNLHASESAAGVFSSTQSSTGLQSSGFLLSVSSQKGSGTFVSTSSMTRSESGSGTFAIADQGSYASGGYDLTDVGLSESAGATFAYSQADTYNTTSAGTFTQTNAGATQNLSVSGTYTARTSSSDHTGEVGSARYTLNQTGTDNNGGQSLSCYVLNSRQSGTSSSTASSLAVQTGVAVSVTTGNTPSSSGIGYDAFSSTSRYGYHSSSTSGSSDASTFSQSTYQAGRYAAGNFALSATAYKQNSRDTWSLSGSDNSFSSGTIGKTQWGVNQKSASGGVNGATILTNSQYTQTNTTAFSSAFSDSYSQNGNSRTTAKQTGAFANYTYALVSVVYRTRGSQSGSTHSNGADTFSTTGSAATTNWSNQGVIGPYGPAGTSTAAGLGSFTNVGQSTYTENSGDTWSQSTSASSSYSLYENGRFAGNSYNLGSLSYKQNASDSWSYQQTETATLNGTDSSTASGAGSLTFTTSSSGASNSNFGSGAYSQSGADTFSSSSSDALNQSGADSSYQFERGRFSGNSFAFSSVVFQSSSGQTSVDQASGQTASSGNSALSFTSTAGQSGLATASSSSSKNLNSTTQSGQSTYAQTASESWSKAASTVSNSTLYEAGTFGGGNYAFASVAYRETDGSTSSSNDVQQSNDNGTDSWTGSNLSRAKSTTATGLVTHTGSHAVAQSTYRDSYLDAAGTTTAQSGTSSSTLTDLGVYAAGSFAFASSVYNAGGSQTGTASSFASSNYTGIGADSFSAVSGQNIATPDGVSGLSSNRTVSTGSDAYFQTGSQSATQTQSYTSSYTLHEAGSLNSAGWSMGSISYGESGSDTQSSLQNAAAADSGTYATATVGAAASSSLNLAANSTAMTQGSSAVSQSALGSYADQSTSTIAQSAASSYSFTELGQLDPVHGYAFSSVVYRAGSVVAGTLQSYASGASMGSSTSNRSATNANSNTNTWANSALPGWGANSTGNSGFTSAATKSYQTGATATTINEGSSSSNNQFQAGIFAAGSYAFTRVTLTSASTDHFTVQQTGTATTTGASSTTMTAATGSSSTTILGSSVTASLALATNNAMASANSSSSSASSFTETSVKHSRKPGRRPVRSRSRGVFAAGTYVLLEYRRPLPGHLRVHLSGNGRRQLLRHGQQRFGEQLALDLFRRHEQRCKPGQFAAVPRQQLTPMGHQLDHLARLPVKHLFALRGGPQCGGRRRHVVGRAQPNEC